MKRIIIDSVALGSVLEEIEQDATMLNYLTDIDDLSDVEYYGQRIRDAVENAYGLIKTAKPAENTFGVDTTCKLQMCSKILEEVAKYHSEDPDENFIASNLTDVSQFLKYLSEEGVKA